MFKMSKHITIYSFEIAVCIRHSWTTEYHVVNYCIKLLTVLCEGFHHTSTHSRPVGIT